MIALFQRPAVLALVLLAALGLGIAIFREHGKLTGELTALHSGEMPTARQNDGASSAESAALIAELANETALLRAAEAKTAELVKSLPPMSGEEWRSLGRVEELGQQAGDLLRTVSEAVARTKTGQPPGEADAGTLFLQMSAWMKPMEAIGEMEEDPEEIARLHTATLASRTTLDAATQTRVKQQIEREFTRLHELKLTRAQLPTDGRDDWYPRRSKALNEAAARVEALIPPAHRVEFAVAQSLHLGTGMRTKTHVFPDGHGVISTGFDLPGLMNF